MAIGTAAAIGLGVAGVGSVLGAKSANKASKRAAQVSADNNAANVALQREIYGENKQILSPFVQRGNAAGQALNDLLGLGGTQSTPTAQPTAQAAYQPFADSTGYQPRSYFGSRATRFGLLADDMPNFFPQNALSGNVVNTSTANPVSSQQAQNNAFENFRNSTGYQFRVNEGMDALNSGYAASGALQSGAALKALDDYRQNMASNEFGNYAGMLQSQQAVGAGAGSSLAGVGQNFANSVTAQNTMNAANQANALTSRQNPLANAMGMIGGGLFNYGMG